MTAGLAQRCRPGLRVFLLEAVPPDGLLGQRVSNTQGHIQMARWGPERTLGVSQAQVLDPVMTPTLEQVVS